MAHLWTGNFRVRPKTDTNGRSRTLGAPSSHDRARRERRPVEPGVLWVSSKLTTCFRRWLEVRSKRSENRRGSCVRPEGIVDQLADISLVVRGLLALVFGAAALGKARHLSGFTYPTAGLGLAGRGAPAPLSRRQAWRRARSQERRAVHSGAALPVLSVGSGLRAGHMQRARLPVIGWQGGPASKGDWPPGLRPRSIPAGGCRQN